MNASARNKRDQRMKVEALLDMARRYDAQDSVFRDVVPAALAEARRYTPEAVEGSIRRDCAIRFEALESMLCKIAGAAVVAEEKECRPFTWSEACSIINDEAERLRSLDFKGLAAELPLDNLSARPVEITYGGFADESHKFPDDPAALSPVIRSNKLTQKRKKPESHQVRSSTPDPNIPDVVRRARLRGKEPK